MDEAVTVLPRAQDPDSSLRTPILVEHQGRRRVLTFTPWRDLHVAAGQEGQYRTYRELTRSGARAGHYIISEECHVKA